MITDHTGKELPSCSSCRWWDDESSGLRGACRRNPPGGGFWRPDDHRMDWIGANWPETTNDDWCGEHQAQLVDLTR